MADEFVNTQNCCVL